eukprot:2339759-Prymnesium_polylepis.2
MISRCIGTPSTTTGSSLPRVLRGTCRAKPSSVRSAVGSRCRWASRRPRPTRATSSGWRPTAPGTGGSRARASLAGRPHLRRCPRRPRC